MRWFKQREPKIVCFGISDVICEAWNKFLKAIKKSGKE